MVRGGVALRGRVVDRRDADECYICPFGGFVFYKIQTLTSKAFGQLESDEDRLLS